MEETRKKTKLSLVFVKISIRQYFHVFARAINHYQLVENGDHVAVFMGDRAEIDWSCKMFSGDKTSQKRLLIFEWIFGLCRGMTEKSYQLQRDRGIPVRIQILWRDKKKLAVTKVAVADCMRCDETILAGYCIRWDQFTLMPKKRVWSRLELIMPFI